MHASWQSLTTRLPPTLLPRSGGAALPLPLPSDGFVLVGGYTEDAASSAPPARAPTGEALLVRAGRAGRPAVVARLASASPAPPPRLAAAGATAGTTAWLIGGWDPGPRGDGGVVLDDLWSVDLGEGALRALPLRWTPHPAAPLPGGPASRHAAAALPDGRIVVFTHRCGDTVLVLHTGGGRGGAPPPPPRGGTVAVRPDPAAGAPPARGLATLVALPPASPGGDDGTATLLLFGGAPKRGGMVSDLWRLRLGGEGGGGRWERVAGGPGGPAPAPAPAAPWPAPRCSHVAAALRGGMVVWGGSFYDAAGGLVARGDAWWWDEAGGAGWGRLAPGGDAPPLPRNAAAAAAVVGEGGKEEAGLLIFGGWDPFRVTYGDSAVLWVGPGMKGERERKENMSL